MDNQKIIMNHMFLFHSRLHDLRHQKQFLDFTIYVDGQEFQVHRLVMASCSDYFKALFRHNSIESHDNRVTLQDVSVVAIEAIIDFCYHCKLNLTVDNVHEIFVAATMLQVTAIQEICVNFIKSRIDASNCVVVATIAERYHLPDLLNLALECCINRFDLIVQTDEFFEMDEKLLNTIIAHDHLYIEDEVEVFQAIIDWVRRDEKNRLMKLDCLMKQVRFALIDPVRLVTLSFNEYIKNSSKCRELIDQAKNYLLLKNHPARSNLIDESLIPNIKPRLALRFRQRIYAVGGWTDEFMSIASAEVYNPNFDQWSELAPMAQKRCGVGLAALGDSIYAVGGHDGMNYLNTIERYDIKENKWFRDVADMRHVRTSVAVAALNGRIYAIGGQRSDGATDKVERYDPKTNAWSSCAPLIKKRLGAGVAVLNGYIYVMGGSEQAEVYDSVECYDPDLDKWTFVAPMTVKRKHLASTTCKSRIYAIGGRNKSGELDSAECYDPNSDSWSLIKPMDKKRCGIGVVELGGLVFAIGGQNEDERLNVVEAYNPETDEWVWKKPMNHGRLGGGMAVYTISD